MALAPLVQERVKVLSEVPSYVEFFDTVPDVPDDFAQEVAWIARRSLPLRNFASPATVRRVMDAITVKLDGAAAAVPLGEAVQADGRVVGSSGNACALVGTGAPNRF